MNEANKKLPITDAEWEVMRVAWAQGKVTSKEAAGILNEKMDWKGNTVKTLLSRLVDKEMLGTEKVGNKFIYYPLMEERKSIENLSEEILGKICNTKAGKLIEQLIELSELSVADVAQLEATIQGKKKTAIEKVICNCVPGQCSCHLIHG